MAPQLLAIAQSQELGFNTLLHSLSVSIVAISMSTPLELFTQFLAKTDGRDKIYRTLQYGARLLGHVLAAGTKPHPDSVSAKCTRLSSSLSDGRKLLRLWKWLNEVVKLPQILNSKEDVRMKALQAAKAKTHCLCCIYACRVSVHCAILFLTTRHGWQKYNLLN